MCGIAGYYSNKKNSSSIIERQLQKIEHRGPDDKAVFSDGPYTGGMRRLSINDIEGGGQPLLNEDGSVTVFYNGEIYNHLKLRKELEKKGHRFKSKSDGEVIAHLYEDIRENLFEKLDGMFAVAIYDKKNERLVLARDIPGEKPLYYYKLKQNEVVFASEIKSLIEFPGLNLDIDLQAIWDLPTFLWIPEPNTIYKNIKALMPGHFLIADNHGISIKKYNNPFESDLTIDGKNDDEIVYEVKRILVEAIKSRLLSDVPIGSFLSGGFDSSLIVTIAKQNLGELNTFSVGFDEDIGNDINQFGKVSDESHLASEYARKIGTKHTNIKINGKKLLSHLDDFVKFGDQPWGVSSGLGVMAVAQAAREAGIKVLLTGDGADECFGGYGWYATLAGKKPDFHYYASENAKRLLFNRELFHEAETSYRWFDNYKKGLWQPKDYVNHDRQFYQTNEMLKKVDRMTMAFSVEGRTPFTAPSVLTLSDKLPFEMMVKNNQLKWVMRQAFKDILPSSIANRPKHGFNHPVDHWLKTGWFHLIEETFGKNSLLSKKGIINKDALETAKKMLFDKKKLNGHTLFTLVMLNRWLGTNNATL